MSIMEFKNGLAFVICGAFPREVAYQLYEDTIIISCTLLGEFGCHLEYHSLMIEVP